MEWKHLPKEIKKEILSWAIDTRTLRGERDTMIRSGLFYVCKEFRELLISISSWRGGNPFIEVNLIRDIDILISSAWNDYLFVACPKDGAYSEYYSVNRKGEKEKLPSEIFTTKGYLIILSDDKIKIFSSFPLGTPLVVMESLSKYLISPGPYSLLNVKETPLGIVSLISSSKNIYSVILDLDKKDIRVLIESEEMQIISPWGIVETIWSGEDEISLHPWNSLKETQMLKRNYDIIFETHKIEGRYYEIAVGYTTTTIYLNKEKILWSSCTEAGSYMGFVSPEVQGLLIIYKNNKSLIIDIMTAEVLYEKDGIIRALTRSSEGKYLLWRYI